MIAYFDTAVFDRIYRKDGCGSADIAALRKAVYGRELTVQLSPHHLEEILLARKLTPQALSARLRQTLSLASLRSLLKPCEHLLIGDVRNYAAQGEAGNPFLHGPVQDDYSSGIAELIESDGEEFSEEFREALAKVRRQKINLTALFERIQAKFKAEVDLQRASERSPITVWNARAEEVAGAIAEAGGLLEECQARGLDGLLAINTVRVAVAMLLAKSGAAPPTGGAAPDFEGLHHVIGAAASGGVFVSGESRLRAMLAAPAAAGLLPERCEVIDLAELLGRVGAR
ncbi:MAG TPA: hypothetical protein VHY56_05945 [Candidatus Binataceae bacterium]|nr:hypothetical protein [Candidatus Binataceae bacterium]